MILDTPGPSWPFLLGKSRCGGISCISRKKNLDRVRYNTRYQDRIPQGGGFPSYGRGRAEQFPTLLLTGAPPLVTNLRVGLLIAPSCSRAEEKIAHDRNRTNRARPAPRVLRGR